MATSNKALVAKHGATLLSIAREREINFLFEASVGGGIPIIRALNSSLTADRIEEITGILNGTTNYMLTKMFYEGAQYDEVLEKLELLPIEDTEKRFFVRISGDEKMRREETEAAFGAVTFVRAEGLENEFGIITEVMTEGAYRKIAEKFEGILHMIRVEE